MALFIDRVDSVPVKDGDFDPQFSQWLWVLVDVLNEDIDRIQNAFNLFNTSIYTAAEITSLDGAGKLNDGILLYDSTNNVYVGRQSGALVKFTTAVYP